MLALLLATLIQIKPPEYEVVHATVFAYNSENRQTDEFPAITASGAYVREGALACPERYPFYTIAKIQGRFYMCVDRMAKKYRDKDVFDIWMPSRKQALDFGKQKLDVIIYP